MCGIAGYVNFSGNPGDPAVLKDMADSIAHRGPDGEGYLTHLNVGLAHRRLSIIDLSDDANQPMTTPSGRWSIVFNGLLYNYRELQRDLEASGEHFHTTCDTEILLRALERWGPDALPRFNGMFALAAYDKKTRQLLLARDRFGVKPLYYAIVGKTLVFGSEIKALLAHPSVTAKLNAEGLAEYLTFMNFIAEQTLFEGVRLFPAGCWAQVNAAQPCGGDLPVRRYWDYRFTGVGHVDNEDALAETIHDTFAAAVKRQMVSDVGVSSYLSGGIDSGSITAVAAHNVKHLRTFTCGFDTEGAGDDAIFDESAAARLMAQTFDTDHHELILGPSDVERVLTPLIRQLEEPRVGQSYPNYMIARLASENEKVILSGTGGDELFGGYPWRYFTGFPAKTFPEFAQGYFQYWRRLTPDDSSLAAALAPIWSEAKPFDPYAAFINVFPAEAGQARTAEDMLNWALYFETKTFLNGLLVVEDKIAMAHALETRVPFLDNELVDLACRIPVSAKLDLSAVDAMSVGGRRMDGKRILRRMMRNLVPAEIHSRPKQGFSAPDQNWFRGPLAPMVRRRLTAPGSRLHEFVDPVFIQNTLNVHERGENRRLMIWALLSLAGVCEAYGL